MSRNCTIRLPAWARLVVILVLAYDIFPDLLWVSAFSSTQTTWAHVLCVQDQSKKTSTLFPLYPEIKKRQRNSPFHNSQLRLVDQASLKISIHTRSLLDVITTHRSFALSLTSDSHHEPERKRMRKLWQSYKFLGRFLKKILKILVSFTVLLSRYSFICTIFNAYSLCSRIITYPFDNLGQWIA